MVGGSLEVHGSDAEEADDPVVFQSWFGLRDQHGVLTADRLSVNLEQCQGSADLGHG
jgi:hypothetical protein